MSQQKFLLFGDSITEFCFNIGMQVDKDEKDKFSFGGELSNDYVNKMDIVHRGFSGYNSRWGLKILPDILKTQNDIAIGTIFFGANDSSLGGHQKVPLNEFIENIGKLVDMFQEKGIRPIVVGPALFNEEYWKTIKADMIAQGYVRTSESFANYSSHLEEYCKTREIPFVNLNKAFAQRAGNHWQEYLCDGLHFNGKGYRVYYRELLKTIDKYYPEYSPSNMPLKHKLWRDVKEDGSNL